MFCPITCKSKGSKNGKMASHMSPQSGIFCFTASNETKAY